LSQRHRIIRWEKPDLILLQKGRHPANWPKYYPGIPTVFDLDDADFLDPGQADQVEACCSQSQGVIAGSRFVAEWCRRFNPNVTVVWTGSPLPKQQAAIRPAARQPILTWAHSNPLLSPEDAVAARNIVLGVARRRPVEFWLYGLDDPSSAEDYLTPFRRAGVAVRTFPYMKYGALLESLAQVAVGLNPVSSDTPYNRGKSFGKVLAYLTAEVAVACSNTLEFPYFFRDGYNGMLINTPEEWVDKVCRLLDDPTHRQSIAERGFDSFREHLSIDTAALKVNQALRQVLCPA
jgi:glycosyltransferase involved in cell wall biosynthesis